MTAAKGPTPMSPVELLRYAPQVGFEPWGPQAQRALKDSRSLIVGVGGLGSWCAQLLVRAGVGFARLVDDDVVDITNLHRQAMYTEADARDRTPKAQAAARRLALCNSSVSIEAVVARVDRHNIHSLADDVDLIIDGTDNFATRFLVNDYCVSRSLPWIFAGVVGCEAQTMTVTPGQTACLRCLLESIPPPCTDATCRRVGVLGPAVSTIASMAAMEAIKLLAGRADALSPFLTKMDLWSNTLHRVRPGGPMTDPPCPCCILKDFEHLCP